MTAPDALLLLRVAPDTTVIPAYSRIILGHLIYIRRAALYFLPNAIIVPILARTFKKDSHDLRTIIVIADIDEGLTR